MMDNIHTVSLRPNALTRNLQLMEFIGKITEKFDEYILPSLKQFNVMRTYIMWPEEFKDEMVSVFRVPGATRGHIKITKCQIDTKDAWKIEDIIYYEDVCFNRGIACYLESIKDITFELNGDYIIFVDPVKEG